MKILARMFSILVIIALIAFLGIVFQIHGEIKIQKQAIEAGVAEYRIVDPKTGKTEFHWINEKKDK